MDFTFLGFATSRIIAFVLLLLAIGNAEVAEQWGFVNQIWQTTDGLPSNVINDIAEDRHGFVWMATGSGVVRFDGVHLKHFGADDGLPDTQVFSLFIDSTERVWIGTRHGLAYYGQGAWHQQMEIPAVPIFSIGQAADGAIWAGGLSGCWRLESGKARSIAIVGADPDIRAFQPDGDEGMWILTRESLCHWHPESPDFVIDVIKTWEASNLTDLAKDNEGRLILCGTGLLLRQHGEEWEDLTLRLKRGRANSLLACAVDSSGTLWLATRNGGLAYLHEGESGTIDSASDLSVDDVRCLMVDSQGLVWAGTNGGGVNRLMQRPFHVFTNAEGLGGFVTTSLAADARGDIWAGTDGDGIKRLEGKRFSPVFRNQLAGIRIRSMCAHSDGSLWVGTLDDGLFRIAEGACQPVPLPEKYGNLPINALDESRDGGLLVGIDNIGALKWRNGRFDALFRGPKLGDYVVYDLIEDSKGQVWIATGRHGLWLFDGSDWRETTLELGLTDLLPVVLHESSDGGIWIGSLGQGLTLLDKEGATRWRRTDGIVSDTIGQIIEDQSGYLWLGSDRGLQRISIAGLDDYRRGSRGHPVTSLRFSRADGLPTPQFTAEHGNLTTQTPSGKLWFAQPSGAVRVDPSKISDSEPSPYVRVESAFFDGAPVWNFEGSGAAEGIILPAGSGTLQIQFASPAFVAPDRSRFQVRMFGLEAKWQEVEGSRVASYSSMPPGTYRFEVVASSRQGKWNPKIASVQVLVQPHYWQTLKFRVSGAVLLIIALSLIARGWAVRRVRRRMDQMMQERRVERERGRIARDLHDDLGASLTEINYLGTLAADAIPRGQVRSRIDGIVARARQMAKSLDEIVWTVNPANDSLSSTANYLCSRTQESLGSVGIRCRLDVDERLPDIKLDSDLRHHLLMATNEAVNNVMKHSEATACSLAFHVESGMLSIILSDNGQGFDLENIPTNRNGLINLQKRMASIEGSVILRSNLRKGTTIAFRIPLPSRWRKLGDRFRLFRPIKTTIKPSSCHQK